MVLLLLYLLIQACRTRLTWEQLKEMKDNGITISNHGFQHVEMGQLSKAAQMENIQKAQQALADKLGITDNPWFCYPYGDKNKDTDAATKDSGIKMAMAMKSGWAHTGIIHTIFYVFGLVMP